MRTRLASTALAGLIVSACAATAPIAVVRADSGTGTEVTAYVYDQTGLVTSVEALPSEIQRSWNGPPVATSPDGTTLDVQWESGVRHREPPVTLIRDAENIVVDINIDGGGDLWSWSGASSGEGLLLGLRFHLASPVRQDQVRLHVHGIFG